MTSPKQSGLLRNRRRFIATAGTAALAPAAIAAVSPTSPRPRMSNEALRALFKDPIWNRETTARLEADIAPGKFVNGYVTGVWNRVTTWLPWMLMGPTPGHILYAGTFSSVSGVDAIPPAVAKRVLERYPHYQIAPEKWAEPSLSSLENYVRTQKPAPVKNQ